MFVALAVLLLLTDLSKLARRRRAPDGGASLPHGFPEPPEPTAPPPPTEWAVAVLFNGFAVLLVVGGVLEARASGSPGLLVGGGSAWLAVLGPTVGMLGRWWRHRG